MKILWDENKAASNLKKHRGISFDEAKTCLLDPVALDMEDPDADGERRYILIGMSTLQRLLTICYSMPDGETYRIISARKPTKNEEIAYAKGI